MIQIVCNNKMPCNNELANSKISKSVKREFIEKKQHVDILVIMEKKIDYETLKLEKYDSDSRARIIVTEVLLIEKIFENLHFKLKKIANQSQKDVLNILKKRNVVYETFWIVNSIAVYKADKELGNFLV